MFALQCKEEWKHSYVDTIYEEQIKKKISFVKSIAREKNIKKNGQGGLGNQDNK